MRLPGPVRAAIGLVVTAADEARHLPERALELPMLAVSNLLQMSLRAQQRYARLTARADELLRGQPSDEPPEWATFDEPVSAGELHDTAFDRIDGHNLPDARSFADLFAVSDPGEREPEPEPAPVEAPAVDAAPVEKAPAKKPATAKKAAKKVAAKNTAAKKAAVKKAPAKTVAKKAVDAPAKAATKRSPATKAARGRSGS
jgi:outer membrane biosynthesis protein TonB